METEVLAPAAVLVLWSIVVLFWMAFTRLPAISKMGGLGKAKPGGRGQDLEGVLPDSVNWKAHNFTHLMEQPTLFYATVLILAVVGASALDVMLAWGYVILRVIHSLWQALINTVPVRFSLFLLSTACLIALAIHAAILTLGAN
ncbi:MAPEG family protein [Novosphingobium cyanobacteriorum]|uniref:MAPEG family protein n=1 Tax=Novosphingobium cyanobacteriorum TaxID=3024215 RepID=A0ABT6CJ37_9SPHN|nr:MAPEG family protein [Novosphingobium cyanobacteriorum]MDF8333925.1 MAPEG family protein [Novosphingobium cyanobacteriorum]